MSETTEYLKERVRELEQEVLDRENDVASYRQELLSANRKLERLIAELNQELKVVHAIQKCLLPTEFPNIQGFEFSSKFIPSSHRGGDYFDIFEHDDRSRFGVMAASSSGHMMSALLLSVLLKVTGQSEARRGKEPNVLMKHICSDLKTQMEEQDQADIFYGLIDRKTSTLRYSKAGSVIALRYDFVEAELQLLNEGDPALRAEGEVNFASHEVPLNPRDRIIICTRGLIESKSLEGEDFGKDRLFRTIKESVTKDVHVFRNHVLYQIQKFSAGQEPLRDMTFLVMEVKDRVIQLAKR
jgi:sigma-B regulation protein RsbU (phosphoserine phosphatase)